MRRDASGRSAVPGVALVTGGAGFVGSALVRHLLAEGSRVVVYDSFFSGRRRHVSGLGPAATVVEGDVFDEGALARVFERHRPEHVYHLVGDTFVPSAYTEPRRFFRINVEGTLAVLQAVARSGARRMLYVSSTEVYGRAERQPLVETDPLAPANTYAVSKLAADQLCTTYYHEHGVPVVVARIFNCYGPRETQPYVVPEVIRQLSRGPVVRLGNADARRDLTFVDDTARGLAALMGSSLPDGRPVHVGSGVSYSVRHVADVCARLFGHERAVVEADPARLRRLDVPDFRADATLLREATGWAPAVPLEEGLRRTVEWYREHGPWSWEDWCPDGVVGAGGSADSTERGPGFSGATAPESPSPGADPSSSP